jgi:hypothetical protein
MTILPQPRPCRQKQRPQASDLCAGAGLLLFSLSLLGLPMSGLQLTQMLALNRELGKLCNDPPQKALIVCRLHAQLLRGY